MEYLKEYIVNSFLMNCINLVMLVLAIQSFKQNKRVSICIFAFALLTTVLSICEVLQDYTKVIGNAHATIVLSFASYVLLPCCAVLFVLFCKGEPKGKLDFLFYLPLLVNFVIYLMMFIPSASLYVVYFEYADSSILHFSAGPLRYSSHIVSALYLIYFLYISFTKIRMKHFINALIIWICTAVIISVVIIETFFSNGDIHLLNTAISISVMFYYLFLFIENNRYDSLTGLFNRSTYFQDLRRMDRSATAIIQFDMNGLKYFNDTYGHQKGDEGLKTIANTIASRCSSKMYAYRLGGDEFVVIVNNLTKELVVKIIKRIKDDLNKTEFSCSIGMAYREDRFTTLDELFKEAEKNMYADKTEFYKNSQFERRKI